MNGPDVALWERHLVRMAYRDKGKKWKWPEKRRKMSLARSPSGIQSEIVGRLGVGGWKLTTDKLWKLTWLYKGGEFDEIQARTVACLLRDGRIVVKHDDDEFIDYGLPGAGAGAGSNVQGPVQEPGVLGGAGGGVADDLGLHPAA